VELRVSSSPPGALVTVYTNADAIPLGGLVVAGETPLAKPFRFPRDKRLWLQLEKRGFQPQIVAVTPDSGQVMVVLVPIVDAVSALAPARVIAVAPPDVTVIRRGFKSEREDEAGSAAATTNLTEAIAAELADRLEVVTVTGPEHERQLRALWRDARIQMQQVDPIRLPFAATPPHLESRAARAAALELGERTGADAILLVAGKENRETGSMKAGKIGIMVAGTAASFGSGYSNAMANGNDFFTYNIYLPTFAEGLAFETILIDCATGEVRWANRGLFTPIPLDQRGPVAAVVKDLMSGLAGPLLPQEELTKEKE